MGLLIFACFGVLFDCVAIYWYRFFFFFLLFLLLNVACLVVSLDWFWGLDVMLFICLDGELNKMYILLKYSWGLAPVSENSLIQHLIPRLLFLLSVLCWLRNERPQSIGRWITTKLVVRTATFSKTSGTGNSPGRLRLMVSRFWNVIWQFMNCVRVYILLLNLIVSVECCRC